MTGFTVASWNGPATDWVGTATDWVETATGGSVLTSAERTAPWDIIPCNSAWAVEAPAGALRPSRTSSRNLCVFLVLSQCLGPIMVQTSLESGLPRWAPPWPSQVIALCGGPGWPPRHFP